MLTALYKKHFCLLNVCLNDINLYSFWGDDPGLVHVDNKEVIACSCSTLLY